MEGLLELVNYLLKDGPAILAAVVAILSALIALFMLIPGESPERELKAVVDFLAKFSRK